MTQDHEPRVNAANETDKTVEKPWLFQRGNKANPRGRPKGVRNKITAKMERILAENAEELLRRAIMLALEDRGGPTLRALLPLLVAPLRERTMPIQCALPEFKTADDVLRGLEAIAEAVRAGELDGDSISTLTRLVDTVRASIVATENEARMREIEKKLGIKGAVQ